MAADATPAKARSGFSLAVGDALATAFFVFVSSTFEEVILAKLSERPVESKLKYGVDLQVADIIGPALGLPGLVAGLSVLVAGLIVFGPVADWIGGPGALFNPSHNVAFAALGQGKMRTHLVRMVGHVMCAHCSTLPVTSYLMR